MSRLLALVSASFLLHAAARAAEPGIAQSAAYPAGEATVTKSLGAGWVRLFFRWDEAETGSPGGGCQRREDFFQNFERRVNAYRAEGVKMLAVVMFSSPCANNGAGRTVAPDPAVKRGDPGAAVLAVDPPYRNTSGRTRTVRLRQLNP